MRADIHRRAFKILVLLVVISIIAVLAVLSIPSISQAIATSRKAACMSNMRQIGVAMPAFAADYNGWATGEYRLVVSAC